MPAKREKDPRWSTERRVVIPIVVRSDELRPFYGGDMPKFKEGTIGELILDDESFLDPNDLDRFSVEYDQIILRGETQLFACMRLRDEFPSTPDVVQGITVDPPLDHKSGLIPFTLETDLVLHLRGTKPAELERCTCRLDTIAGARAVSVNNAYSQLSERYEPWRKSHTGNVFTEVYFLEDGIAKRLDLLRQRATAELEKELFRRSGLLPLDTRTKPD